MTKYAVIRLQGKQYKVVEGQEILVDKINDPKIQPEVLLFVADKIKIGKPSVKDVKVKTKILSEQEFGQKIEIYKFKAKSRYKRHTGFRPQYTKLLIESIS